MEVQERIKQRRLDMGLSVDRMISELKKVRCDHVTRNIL